MGKIKRKSLKRDFVKYFLICTICILIGSLLMVNFAENFFHRDAIEYVLFVGEKGSVEIRKNTESISEKYVLLLDMADLFKCTVIPLWSLICIVICGIIFYRRKIEKPVAILSGASENISNNRLDFSVEAPEENELGDLCLSFEKMRAALQDNNLEMWRQVEERKRLNAAFAHDLRTPLTVLKGQSEMLVKYAPKMSEDKIVSTAEMMKRHIIRLENYVDTMSDLQRLEDIEVTKECIEVKEFEKQLRITGTAICTEKDFTLFQNLSDRQSVKIDIPVVMQVYENLLSNALRYTKTKIEVTVDRHNEFLMLIVADDGTGFTSKDLSNAMKPFYRAESESHNEHFGMGLNICKILCEKHGGYIQISNENGAKVIAAFKE